MTVFENDFPQHEKMAETIVHEQYEFNAFIRRPKKNNPTPAEAWTSYGNIYIRQTADKDEQYFGGLLTHESNHIVHDPVNFWNYAEYIDEIKKRLSIPDKTGQENMLANIASDLIIEHNLSKRYSNNKKGYYLSGLSKYHYMHTINHAADAMKAIMEKIKGEYPELKIDEGKASSGFQTETMIEFGNILGKFHGFHIPNTPEPKLYDKVMEIIKAPIERKKQYVRIAALFKPLMDKDQKQMEQKGKDIVLITQVKDKDGNTQTVGIPISEEEKKELEKRKKLMPINPSKQDLKEYKERILGQAKTSQEAKEKLDSAKAMIEANPSISAEGHFELELDEKELLLQFYNAKADQVLIAIDFPRQPTRKGLEVSHKRWNISDNMHEMDIEATISKHGMNIPTITTLAPKIIPKFISDTKQTKPLDLIISIDTSGSTGYPSGGMNCEADYEIVLLFAILKMARKIDQRVGLTLWETQLYYKVPPVEWKQFEELIKKAIFTRWSSGGTTMTLPMQYAIDNPKQFHFTFTDGRVFDSRLTPESLKGHWMKKLKGRIHFFLAAKDYLQQFQDAAGTDSVTDASDLTKLPRIGLQQWKNIFWRT